MLVEFWWIDHSQAHVYGTVSVTLSTVRVVRQNMKADVDVCTVPVGFETYIFNRSRGRVS